jgi:DNA-binding NarL/FixJ family response regulator
VGFAAPVTVSDSRRALTLLARKTFDLVLVDLELAGQSGAEFIRAARFRGYSGRLVAFSAHDSPKYVAEALEAGADGYIVKGIALTQLREQLLAVHSGGIAVAPEVWGRVLESFRARSQSRSSLSRLSKSELRVIELTAKGHDCKSIARELSISVNTVYAHNKRVFSKLGVHTRGAVVALYLQSDEAKG